MNKAFAPNIRSKMPIKFYSTAASPPCRSVWMLMDILGVEYEWVETHPIHGDTKTPEYLKVKDEVGRNTPPETLLVTTSDSRAPNLRHFSSLLSADESPAHRPDSGRR